jgi:hypothetical protein
MMAMVASTICCGWTRVLNFSGFINPIDVNWYSHYFKKILFVKSILRVRQPAYRQRPVAL